MIPNQSFGAICGSLGPIRARGLQSGSTKPSGDHPGPSGPEPARDSQTHTPTSSLICEPNLRPENTVLKSFLFVGDFEKVLLPLPHKPWCLVFVIIRVQQQSEMFLRLMVFEKKKAKICSCSVVEHFCACWFSGCMIHPTQYRTSVQLANGFGQWCCPVLVIVLVGGAGSGAAHLCSPVRWPTWQVYRAACALMHAHVRIYFELIIPITIICIIHPIQYFTTVLLSSLLDNLASIERGVHTLTHTQNTHADTQTDTPPDTQHTQHNKHTPHTQTHTHTHTQTHTHADTHTHTHWPEHLCTDLSICALI